MPRTWAPPGPAAPSASAQTSCRSRDSYAFATFCSSYPNTLQTSLSFHDLFKFVSSAHPLVKFASSVLISRPSFFSRCFRANLLEYFESDRPLSSSLTFIPPAQAALLGKAMGDHDMLKIDGTALAEVLQEETGQRDPNKQAQQDEAEKVDEKSEKSEEEEAGGLKLPAGPSSSSSPYVSSHSSQTNLTTSPLS